MNWRREQLVQRIQPVRQEAGLMDLLLYPRRCWKSFTFCISSSISDGLGVSLDPYPRRTPCPPSPSLTVQRLIREQQDDEFLASLQADRDKELKAKEEVEAALAEERLREEAMRKKLQEEQDSVLLFYGMLLL